MSIKAMAVFCGSRLGNDSAFANDAASLGMLLAQHEISVIYGGGNKGLMAEVANSALEASGTVIGIIPKMLAEWEHQHNGLSDLLVVETMHIRKQLLYEKCDAAVILPGGYGTLDEVFEMLTWNQLDLHRKQLFLLNTSGFYDHLIAHINQMKKAGFLYAEAAGEITVLNKPEDLIPFFK